MELITAAEKAKELGISRATLSRRVTAQLITPAFTAANGNQYFRPSAPTSPLAGAELTPVPVSTSPEVVEPGTGVSSSL